MITHYFSDGLYAKQAEFPAGTAVQNSVCECVF